MKALLTGDDSKVVDVEYFVSTFPLAKSNIYYYRGILSLKKIPGDAAMHNAYAIYVSISLFYKIYRY